MISDGVIPSDYLSFYESRPVAGNTGEYLPDRDLLDPYTDEVNWNEESNKDDLAPLFQGSGTACKRKWNCGEEIQATTKNYNQIKQQEKITKGSKPQSEIETKRSKQQP